MDLIPRTDWVSPNKAGDARGHKGWAYCAALSDRSEILLYFEVDCPMNCEIRSLKARAEYEVYFFDPRKGIWLDSPGPTVNPKTNPQMNSSANSSAIKINDLGISALPARPDRYDYGMYLKRV